MTAMIPLKALQNDHTELRYCLRSLDKFVKPDEVLILGETIPDWINNVTQISVKDRTKKQFTIRRKILAALEYTEEVLYLSDDVYVLRENDFPFYYFGDLKNSAGVGMKQTHTELTKMKKPTLNYNLHQPMIFDRRFKMLEMFSSDVLPKSAYCNYFKIPGVQFPDCKIFGKMTEDQIMNRIKGNDYFSTAAAGLKYALPVLNKLFPKKSIYEL